MRKITIRPKDLESRVEQSRIPRKALARKFVDYLLPFLDKYDYAGQAKRLLDDDEIRQLGVNGAKVVQYLEESKYEHRWLRYAGKLADTTDKATSIAAMIFEAMGISSLIGTTLSVPADVVEDAGELIFKVPFMALLYFDKKNIHRLNGLLVREALTFMPVLGDIYDATTNLYMKTAEEVIREHAKQRLIEDFGTIRIT